MDTTDTIELWQNGELDLMSEMCRRLVEDPEHVTNYT